MNETKSLVRRIYIGIKGIITLSPDLIRSPENPSWKSRKQGSKDPKLFVNHLIKDESRFDCLIMRSSRCDAGKSHHWCHLAVNCFLYTRTCRSLLQLWWHETIFIICDRLNLFLPRSQMQINCIQLYSFTLTLFFSHHSSCPPFCDSNNFVTSAWFKYRSTNTCTCRCKSNVQSSMAFWIKLCSTTLW